MPNDEEIIVYIHEAIQAIGLEHFLTQLQNTKVPQKLKAGKRKILKLIRRRIYQNSVTYASSKKSSGL